MFVLTIEYPDFYVNKDIHRSVRYCIYRPMAAHVSSQCWVYGRNVGEVEDVLARAHGEDKDCGVHHESGRLKMIHLVYVRKDRVEKQMSEVAICAWHAQILDLALIFIICRRQKLRDSINSS